MAGDLLAFLLLIFSGPDRSKSAGILFHAAHQPGVYPLIPPNAHVLYPPGNGLRSCKLQRDVLPDFLSWWAV